MRKIDIWYLENIKDFEKRKIIIGEYRGNFTACLIETRKTDGKVFSQTEFQAKARKILENEKNRLLYKRSEFIKSRKGKPYGWTYGENKEIKNNKGQIVSIRQKRVDWFGNKELVEEYKCNL